MLPLEKETMKTVDEQNIIRMLTERDEAALGEVERQYGPRCLKAAGRILGEEESAKECLNDLLLSVWNSIPPFVPQSLEAYLLARIRQIAISRLRKETAAKRGGGALTLALEELEEVTAAEGGPAEEAEKQALREAIGRFVKALPAPERKLFLLRYWELEKPEEIARRTDLTVNSVNTKLHRIRKSLKKALEKEGWIE